MKYTFLTPGPSQLYPTVPNHIKTALKDNVPSISHREEFIPISRKATEGLQKLLAIPKEYYVVFVSSGTEAMERIVENTVEKKSLHFVAGAFSKRWHEIAQELGKSAQKLEADFGKGFHKVPAIPKNTELICFTQNETDAGVAIHPEFIYKIATQNPQALIAVDTVSSAPYVDLDYKKLDCVFFSVQKLFGLPAGLGVIILSPKAIEKAKYLQRKGINIGTYHNFPTLIEFAIKDQTPNTPNVLDIFLLGEVIADMNKKGIKQIREETEEKAKLLYNFFDKHTFYKPFVEDKPDRSQTVITLTTGKDTEKVKTLLKEQRLIIGGGYGPLKNEQIRIANFPAVTIKDLSHMLEVFNHA